MRRVVVSLVGLAASAAAVVILLRSVDLGLTARAIGAAQIAPLLPTLPLVALGIWLRSWRWQRLLPEEGQSVPVRRIAPVVLIGYLGNSVLPARLGEPIRAYVLARQENLGFAAVFGTALLERIVDLTVLAVMAFLAATLIGAPSWAVQLLGIAALGGLAIIAVLAVFGLEPSLRIAHRLLARVRAGAFDRFLGPFERFASGIGGRSRRRPLLQATALSVFIWLVDGSICWLVAWSLGLGFSLAAAVLVVGIGALGTSIPSAPGYVGTYELAMSTMARAIGAPPEAALGFALVLHGITLIPVAIGGIVSLMAIGSGDLFSLVRAAQVEQEAPR
jgi:glycosyltransferase 2 family protein